MPIIRFTVFIYIVCIEQTHVDGTVMKIHCAFEYLDIGAIDLAIDKDIEVIIAIGIELMRVII